ncbi:hypothetical protein CEY11_06275 [Candidimonas nitroreducens]|uniref:Uncharacterized protein n=1 Tax=Candidimonas nitroreducens TaxID=683354 RepID=A0A225MRM5_9BURK|nr:hypothetical protein CEY11_06275 [Candidimonas nitroreducens]
MDSQLNPEQRIMSAHLTPQEMVMLSKQRWEDVRQMHPQGASNSEIARHLEIAHPVRGKRGHQSTHYIQSRPANW